MNRKPNALFWHRLSDELLVVVNTEQNTLLLNQSKVERFP
jgi:hypothetical protein